MTLILRLCVIWLVVVLGPLAWLARSGINFNETIAPTAIRSDGGFIFVAPVHAPPLFEAWPDSVSAPTASNLRLLEDGKELGPAHTVYAVISSKGHGSFSHWSTNLLFSSSDSTDPRTNGRQYSAAFPIFPAVQAVLIVILGPMVFLAIARITYEGFLHLRLSLKRRFVLPGILSVVGSLAVMFMAVTAWWSLIVQDHSPIPSWLYVVLAIVPLTLLLGRDPVARSKARSGGGLGASSSKFVRIEHPMFGLSSLSRLAGLTILYSALFALVYCSLVAQNNLSGTVKINFEYRIF
jgi:hypothetical protein